MQAQRLNITLPYEIARDFKRTIPERSRSKFIAKILKEKLPSKRRNIKAELSKSLKANYEFYKKVAHEWKATEVEGWPE